MKDFSSSRLFLLLPAWAVKPDFRRFFRLPPSQRPFYPRPVPPQGGRYQLNRLRCSRLPEKLMKTSAPPAPEAPKAPRTHKQRPAHWCRRCPFCGPGGQCLDRRLKSGRCGDWVWYLRDGRQLRRLYVKPQDPLSPAQRDCRAQFGAASARYSHSLTEKQRAACIAAGVKVQSRPRLGQSGPLTGQQYSIRRDYAAKAVQTVLESKSMSGALQTKGISLSSSGTHRSITVQPPEHYRLTSRRAGKPRGSRTSGKSSRQQTIKVPRLRQGRRITPATPRHAAFNRGVSRISGRASAPASPHSFPPLAKWSRPQIW
jgi:hypothetical protein